MEAKKKRKIWPWILIAIIIVFVILAATFLKNAGGAANTVAYDTYTVTQGSIISTVTGSGELESVDTENIDVPDGITILDIPVKLGDNVVAGDTLATLDTASLKDRAAYLLDELSTIDNELARMSSSKTAKYIYASAKGRVKYLPVSKDSDVIGSIDEFGSLALISTDGLMKVKIKTTQELAISTEVTVKWQDGSDEGQIAGKTDDGYIITLEDDKAPYNVTAQIYNSATLLGEGTLEIHAPVAVYANGGTVSKVYFDLDDQISADSKLLALENGPFSNTYQQKYSERTDIAEQLEKVLKYQNDPRVIAISDGVLSAINLTEGGETGAVSSAGGTAADASGESTAFEINTGGALKMEVAVDELDIHSVALDRNANVTLDAIASEEFAAKVTHISNLGNVAGSITTFSVELTLSPDARFLEGMNGNATILVDQVDNVLVIPVEAINEDASGAYVYVGSGREKTYITTGVSDGEYAEITSGLTAGDVIQYTKSSSGINYFGSPFDGDMSSSPFSGGMSNRGGETNDK